MIPIPSPARPCQRYHRNGLRCTTLTPRRDGWCGTCDGYAKPQPPDHPTAPRPATGRQHPPREFTFPALDLEDVPALRLTNTAIEQFIQHHGGDREGAVVQIRSLIEDIILMPVRRGRWDAARRLWVIGTREFAYSVLLTEDLTVIAYRTKHQERTWAQVKAGIPSRVSRKRKAATKEPERRRTA